MKVKEQLHQIDSLYTPLCGSRNGTQDVGLQVKTFPWWAISPALKTGTLRVSGIAVRRASVHLFSVFIIYAAEIKHYKQEQLGEEKIYFFLKFIIPSSREAKAGTWRQQLMQRPWIGAVYWFAQLWLAQCAFS